jgi:hypothetical protein
VSTGRSLLAAPPEARTVSGAGKRAAIAVISVLVAAIGAVGVVLLISVPSTRAARDTFNAATPYRCGHAAPPAGISCWDGVDGRLTALSIQYSLLGARQLVASVATAEGIQQVAVADSPPGGCVTAGQAVVLRRLNGAVTTVFTPAGTMATADNPNVDSSLAFDGGITLLAVALLIPAGLVLTLLRRRRRGRTTDVLEAYTPPLMRWALAAFLLGQLTDVVTSALGQAVGLGEANSLVDVFVRVTGPLGFLLFRLPAVVLVLLGLSQVPRRIAAATLILMAAIFMSVGVHNAVLAAGAGAQAVCGGPVPLP